MTLLIFIKKQRHMARRPSGQCAQRAIAEAKQRLYRSVIRWVTKIFYLELLRASEGRLSYWSRLLCSR
jgi:hypothetical protein